MSTVCPRSGLKLGGKTFSSTGLKANGMKETNSFHPSLRKFRGKYTHTRLDGFSSKPQNFPKRYRIWFPFYRARNCNSGELPMITQTVSEAGFNLHATGLKTLFLSTISKCLIWVPETFRRQTSLVLALLKCLSTCFRATFRGKCNNMESPWGLKDVKEWDPRDSKLTKN